MAVEDHNGEVVSPQEECPDCSTTTASTRERSFDELAKGLANGKLSRRGMLRMLGGALLGGTLASIPGVAWAAKPGCASGVTCKGKCCPVGATCTKGAGGGCTCPTGQTACGGQCVSLTTNQNCGSCGNACSEGKTCQGGTCACLQGQTDCEGVCRNLLTDTANCGICGNACATGASCVNGQCVCPSGQEPCNGTCLDLSSDPNNCGQCDNACSAGQGCINGKCLDACPPTSCCCNCNYYNELTGTGVVTCNPNVTTTQEECTAFCGANVPPGHMLTGASHGCQDTSLHKSSYICSPYTAAGGTITGTACTLTPCFVDG
jgi:hypothetical protein